MLASFYNNQTNNQINSKEFKSEQTDFETRNEIIKEVQDEYKLYIDHYLKKDQSKWVDASLFDLINANNDQDKVITFINYEIKDNPENLSKDNLTQLKNLKTVLQTQDYKEKIKVFPNNVNFWIMSGIYKEKNWEEYEITYNKVIKLRKNKYKLILQTKWSNTFHKYKINFDWSDYVSIYNQFWIRLWREKIKKEDTVYIEGNKYKKWQYQTKATLEIHSKEENIKLDLLFVD